MKIREKEPKNRQKLPPSIPRERRNGKAPNPWGRFPFASEEICGKIVGKSESSAEAAPKRGQNLGKEGNETMEQVTIVGRGALGILYGHALTQCLGPDKVTFLAEGERLNRLRQEEAWCNGEPCQFQVTDHLEGPAQLLLFAVKAPDLEEAMALAAPYVGEETVILSLLNGVTSEEALSQTFGPEKVLYAVAQGMDAVREGSRLTYTHGGTLFLGLPEEDYFDRGEKLEAAYALLSQMDLEVVKETDILHRMWCKFMLNVGVNQVCAAYGCPYGGVQAPGPARDAMVAAMDEARKVGACQGVLVTQKDRTAYLAVVDGLNPEALPSMAQDVLAHRKTEVEAFAGQVIQLAEFYGMAVPVNRDLYEKLQAIETNW